MAEPVMQAVIVEDASPLTQTRNSAWLRFWRQIGGGSLMLSIAVHVGLLLVAGMIIVGTQMAKPVVDFYSGGPNSGKCQCFARFGTSG